ncbi:hypothetical protein AB0C06_19610 [Micromonospora inaquosa]|uniref:Uncharacterized protein n=1 Tax=Micromonospora inaquosa TaxID=2203716 RepID=A0A3N9W482_9ACTN|nr:hypothetical protein [Micromonospora inaquosa]RQW95605.1 hypothetical protein DLJ59_32675 [Micromonospora inaquosa]
MVAGIARHLAGMAVAWLAFVAEAIVGYVGLLAYALATGSGLGGPLAGPMLALVAAVLGVALLPVLFLPAVLVAEAARRRQGTGRVVALAAPIAAALAAVYAAVGAIVTRVSAGYVPLVAAIAALLVLAPVVLYALTACGVRGVGRRFPGHWDGSEGVAAEAG